MTPLLGELLGRHLSDTHTSVNRLSKISGIPQRTLANWLEGHTHRPHRWQDIVQVAAALHLSISETNAMLRAAGYDPLDKLQQREGASEDQSLINSFITPLSIAQNTTASPFQAIASLPTFIGRKTEIEAARKALLTDGRAALCGLRGMGGVGKTVLAAQLAYQLRDDFPDGVLWARLDTSDTLSILSSFADAYGKDVSQYKDAESRAAIVRNILAKKRALIILDNAETSAEVRPLLPPSTGTNVVLITTRHDLSVLDGWTRLTLGPFDPAENESMQLFEKYLGRKVVYEQHELLSEIAMLAGHLPLALSIVAGRLSIIFSDLPAEPDRRKNAVSTFLTDLRQSRNRLDVLTRDDLGVRTSFDVSYATLTPELKKLFALLGIFSAEDFSTRAIAYLADVDIETAERLTGALQTLSLVQEGRAGRWRLHPLLRDFAREQLQHFGWMVPAVEKILKMFRDAVQGQWDFAQSVDAEMPNIQFALDQAGKLKLHAQLIETVKVVYPVWSDNGWFSLARQSLEQALVAARDLSDAKSEIQLLTWLARMQMALGDVENGEKNLHLGLQIARANSQFEVVAEILSNIGKLENEKGNRAQGALHLEESLVISRQIDARSMIARNLNNLALFHSAQARYSQAETMLFEALEIFRGMGLMMETLTVMLNLGEVYGALSDWDNAERYRREALALARENNYRATIITLLVNIAENHVLRNDLEEAERSLNEAIEKSAEVGSLRLESIAQTELGEVLRLKKQSREALKHLNRGLELAIKVGDMERKAVTLRYMGILYLEQKQLKKARRALDDALTTVKESDNIVIPADIQFVQARVAFASEDHDKAEQLANDCLYVYEKHGLARQAQEVREWLSGLADKTA